MEVKQSLTSRELVYLNTALDAKDILGVHKAEVFMEDIKNNISEEKSLINKGILNEDGSISEISYYLINKLEQYKKAESYLNINGMFFSVTMKETSTVYLKKNENNEYEIDRLEKPMLIYSLCKSYPFIFENREIEKETKRLNLKEVINDKLKNINENEVFFIRKGNGKEAYNSYIYFIENEITYKYDVINGRLETISPKNIRMDLFRILEVRGIHRC